MKKVTKILGNVVLGWGLFLTGTQFPKADIRLCGCFLGGAAVLFIISHKEKKPYAEPVRHEREFKLFDLSEDN